MVYQSEATTVVCLTAQSSSYPHKGDLLSLRYSTALHQALCYLSSVLQLELTQASPLSSALRKMSPLSGECSVRPHRLCKASPLSQEECKLFVELLRRQLVSLWMLWMRVLQTWLLPFYKSNISILALLSYLRYKYSYSWEDTDSISKGISFHTYPTHPCLH